jgi:hypothetical protein
MTKENEANAVLLSVAIFLGSAIPTILASNFWFGIIAIVAVIAVVAVREVLP